MMVCIHLNCHLSNLLHGSDFILEKITNLFCGPWLHCYCDHMHMGLQSAVDIYSKSRKHISQHSIITLMNLR